MTFEVFGITVTISKKESMPDEVERALETLKKYGVEKVSSKKQLEAQKTRKKLCSRSKQRKSCPAPTESRLKRPLPVPTARTKRKNRHRTVSLMNECGRTVSAG